MRDRFRVEGKPSLPDDRAGARRRGRRRRGPGCSLLKVAALPGAPALTRDRSEIPDGPTVRRSRTCRDVEGLAPPVTVKRNVSEVREMPLLRQEALSPRFVLGLADSRPESSESPGVTGLFTLSVLSRAVSGPVLIGSYSRPAAACGRLRTDPMKGPRPDTDAHTAGVWAAGGLLYRDLRSGERR